MCSEVGGSPPALLGGFGLAPVVVLQARHLSCQPSPPGDMPHLQRSSNSVLLGTSSKPRDREICALPSIAGLYLLNTTALQRGLGI